MKEDTSRFDLSGISIQDFELRVKRFAHPINKGKVSIHQLMEAFKNTKIFDSLANPRSEIYRLLVSPFFTDFKLKRRSNDCNFLKKANSMHMSQIESEDDQFDSFIV